MVSVSRWAQVFLTQILLRPTGYTLSHTLDTTPSSTTLRAWANISRPSISKLSVNWTSVLASAPAPRCKTAESRILVGYVRAWLRDTFAAFTAAGIKE